MNGSLRHRYDNADFRARSTRRGCPTGVPDGGARRWGRGESTVNNPDEGVIERMKQARANFGARIQGDEGEFY